MSEANENLVADEPLVAYTRCTKNVELAFGWMFSRTTFYRQVYPPGTEKKRESFEDNITAMKLNGWTTASDCLTTVFKLSLEEYKELDDENNTLHWMGFCKSTLGCQDDDLGFGAKSHT
jgi:hypothetical protein